MSKAAQKAQFYHQLATLLSSGLSISLSVQHLQQQQKNALHAVAAGLARGVGEGMTLGDALKSYGGSSVDSLDVAVLQAAERGGKLEIGTSYLAGYYEILSNLWAQVRSGLAYPFLVLHAAILLPSLGEIATGSPGAWMRIIQSLLIAYAVIAVVWFGVRWLHRESEWNHTLDRLLGAVPFLGSLRRSLALARFTQVLQIQLETGGTVSEAVKSAGKAAGTACLKSETKLMAQKIIDEGVPLGPLLLASKAIPSSLGQVLHTAEAVGRLDEESGRQARLLMTEATKGANSAGVWLPKLIYLPIAAYAIYRILGFYSGYIDSISNAFGT